MSRRKGNDGMLVVMDRLRAAFERERENRRPRWPMEMESSFARVFQCVCCGRERRDEQRREPRSEVCIHCVAAAGFEV